MCYVALLVEMSSARPLFTVCLTADTKAEVNKLKVRQLRDTTSVFPS